MIVQRWSIFILLSYDRDSGAIVTERMGEGDKANDRIRAIMMERYGEEYPGQRRSLGTRIERSQLMKGDHIFSYRTAIYLYAHHGIYVGGDEVVHFTNREGGTTCSNSSSSGFPCSSRGLTSSSSSPGIPTSCGSSRGLTTSSSSPGIPSSFGSSRGLTTSSSSPGIPSSFGSSSSSSPSPGIPSSFGSSSSSSSSPGFLGSFGSKGGTGSTPRTCQNVENCGEPKHHWSGVLLSCLDCFLDGGKLFRYEYGVTKETFNSRNKGGTCTMAPEDTDPRSVIHRAMYLFEHGFGKYSLQDNNCEDFALYCKTGLLSNNKTVKGKSGQVFRFYLGAYPFRWAEFDLGLRCDVVKVPVEKLAFFQMSLDDT